MGEECFERPHGGLEGFTLIGGNRGHTDRSYIRCDQPGGDHTKSGDKDAQIAVPPTHTHFAALLLALSL